MRPVIALLTDFGLARSLRRHDEGRGARHLPGRDARRHLARHPAARRAGRRARARGRRTATFRPAPSFSRSSIPASDRRGAALAAEAGDYRFVAPDNGVLTLVLDEMPPHRVVELTERRYARPTVSRTFEGRDRFAPAAAWLAGGLDLAALGRAGRTRASARHAATGRRRPAASTARCVRVDRFGNLITNIDRQTFERSAAAGRRSTCRSARTAIAGVVSTYADVAPGELCALFGSSDHLEIAARGASAARAPRRRPRRRRARRSALRDSISLPPFTMISFDLTDEQRLLEQSVREWGAREIAPHIREADRAAPLRSRARARRDGEARAARHLGAAGVRRRRHGLHVPRPGQRGARVRRHLAARDHVGARRPELPDAADVGHRGSEAALSRAAGAGQEDRRLRPDRAGRRQRRPRDPDDGRQEGRAATC